MYPGRACFSMPVTNIPSFCFYSYHLCYIKGLEKWVFFNLTSGLLYTFVLRSLSCFLYIFYCLLVVKRCLMKVIDNPL